MRYFLNRNTRFNCNWQGLGSAEVILHSTSVDLIHWTMRGHPVQPSRREGYGDEHMAVTPFVIRGMDERFYMFYSGWRHLKPALVWSGPRRVFSPCESPFVLRHPRTQKYLMLLNWDYAVSDDPLQFNAVQPLPFPAGLHYPPGAVTGSGEGWESVGIGFAREVIEFEGNNYLSGVFGKSGELKLGFTRFEWTEDFLQLAYGQESTAEIVM